MVLKIFRNIIISMILSAILCVFGMLLSYYFQNQEIAFEFVREWILDFNGLLIGGVTWGLLYFFITESRLLLKKIELIINFDEKSKVEIFIAASKLNNWKKNIFYGVLLGIPGMCLLWICGYPLTGFAKGYLFVGSGILHLTAATILVYIILIIRLFGVIDYKMINCNIKNHISLIELNNINLFFIITATTGFLATYLAFRGTITAGFEYPSKVFENLLLYPLIVYLPLGLFFSFYPRYIVKKLYVKKLQYEITNLDNIKHDVKNKDYLLKEELELYSLVLELKNQLLSESKKLPLLSINDYPSLIIVFTMFVQLVIQKDNIISNFFLSLSK